MWRKVLVKKFKRPFHGAQSGISTIAMVVLSGISLVMVAGTVRMMDNRKTYLEIVRMNTSSNLLEKRIQNAGQSMLAMEISARAAGSGSSLYQCIIQRNCQSSITFERFNLYNAGRERLAGLKTLSGDQCEGECPIRVETFYSITCGDGVESCTEPSEIQTRYRIMKNSEKFFGNRDFPNRDGLVSLSTFACKEGEYITGISSDGVISCDKAIASRNTARCDPGSAAFGLSEDGLLKCIPVVDYCSANIAFSYVLDVSGSMNSGGKLNSAKNSGSAFIDRLKTGDQGSLTTFGNSAQLQVPVSKNFGQLKSSLNQVQARGGTNMSSGIKTGAESLEGVTNSAKVMVFLSDGHHNRGDVDPVQAARLVKDQGVRIYTVGFGKNPDRNRLMQIASSPADYYDATNAGNLNQVFNNLSQLLCRAP